MLYGEGVKISDDMIPDVTKQPDVMSAAQAAGKTLGQRLRDGHDRMKVTERMKAKMMSLFEESA